MTLKKLKFPSKKAIALLRTDKECSEYLQQLIDETVGEVLYNPNNNDLVGYVFVYKEGKNKGFMFNLWVDEKYRGNNLGDLMTKDAINKYDAIDLTVGKDNTHAINIYKNNGFVVVGDGNTPNEYYMKLSSK